MKDILAGLVIFLIMLGVCFLAVDAWDKEAEMWEQRVPETMKKENNYATKRD